MDTFSALMLLVGSQEEYLARKRCDWWLASGATCKCFAHGRASLKIQIGLTFLVPAYTGCQAVKQVPVFLFYMVKIHTNGGFNRQNAWHRSSTDSLRQTECCWHADAIGHCYRALWCLCWWEEPLSTWSLSLCDDRSPCVSRLSVWLWWSSLLDSLVLLPCLFRSPHSVDFCRWRCRLCSTALEFFVSVCDRCCWPSLSLDELLLPRLFSKPSLWSDCRDVLLDHDDPLCRSFPSVFTVLDLSSFLGSTRTFWYVDWRPSTAVNLSRLWPLSCLRGLRDLLCWCKLSEEPISLLLCFSCLTWKSFLLPVTPAYFPLPEFPTSSGNSDFTWTEGKTSLETGSSRVDDFTVSLLRLRDRLLPFFFFFSFFFFFLSSAFASPPKCSATHTTTRCYKIIDFNDSWHMALAGYWLLIPIIVSK